MHKNQLLVVTESLVASNSSLPCRDKWLTLSASVSNLSPPTTSSDLGGAWLSEMDAKDDVV
jgi:hypothetical protein